MADDSFSESAPLVLVSQPHHTRERAVGCLRATGRWSLNNLLLLLTIASVLVGVIIGASVRQAVDITEISGPKDPTRIAYELIKFPGEIFLRMLQMLILPLIVFSLLAGLGSLEAKVAGSLGWKTVAYYFSTTGLAIVLGLTLVLTIQPGSRFPIERDCDNETVVRNGHLATLDSILDLLRNFFPDNLVTATYSQSATLYASENVTEWIECVEKEYNSTFNASCALAEEITKSQNLSCVTSTREVWKFSVGRRNGTNILGIIVFTIAFAIVLSRVGPGGRSIIEGVAVLNEAIMKLVGIVMWYSPVGIASIIAGKILEVESYAHLVQEIGLYFTTVMLGLFIHGCLTLPLLYLVLTRKNPLRVVRAVVQALLTAFGTSSSSATLPITIRNLEDNFSADPRVTRFMLPIGATINMDGTALYEAVAAVFIAQYEDINPSIPNVIIIAITAMAASVGAAGVPQAGLFTLFIVLVAAGLPTEDVALILVVDWLLDRFRTVINVLGDSFGVGIVQHYSQRQLSNYDSGEIPTNLNGPPSAEMSSIPLHPATTQPGPAPIDGSTPKEGGYGSSYSPPLQLHALSTPTTQWSVSTRSLDNEDNPQVFLNGPVDERTDDPSQGHSDRQGNRADGFDDEDSAM